VNNPSYGIQTPGSGVNVQIGGSTITGNGTGVSGSGLVSFKNNQIGDDATDGTPINAFAGPGGTMDSNARDIPEYRATFKVEFRSIRSADGLCLIASASHVTDRRDRHHSLLSFG
jgi:hypothetical protein